MILFVLALLALAFFAVMISAVWRGNSLYFRAIDEVNARANPNERLNSFVNTWKHFGLYDRHKELYPDSDIWKRQTRLTVVVAVSLLLVFICVNLLLVLRQR